MVWRACIIVFFSVIACAASAQQEQNDGSYLEQLLEDVLSGEGRDVSITGFSGALSSQARLQRMEIADSDGIWLILENAELDWSRSALLRGALEIKKLRADRLEILRQPTQQDSALLSAPETSPFTFPQLPVSVEIGRVSINQLTLGPSLLGERAVFDLEASAVLETDLANFRLNLSRHDAFGQLQFSLGYTATDDALKIGLSLEEAEGGLVTRSSGIPNAPQLTLEIVGAGTTSDLTTDIRLQTGGVNRLSGQVILEGLEGGGTAFSSNLTGDIASLFAPEYRDFFGSQAVLAARGTRDIDGAISLEEMRFDTRAVDVRGRVVLTPSGWPRLLDIHGRVADDSGAPVLLPIPGAETRMGAADFALVFDAEKGDDISAHATIVHLERETLSADTLSVRLGGQLVVPVDAPAALNASLEADALGLVLTGGQRAETVGASTRGVAKISVLQGEYAAFRDMTLSGKGYTLSGEAVFHDIGMNTRAEFDLSANIEDMRMFSGVSDRSFSGEVVFNAKGSATPLDGGFDVALTGTGRDLAIGLREVDRLARGESVFRAAVSRNASGITVDRIELKSMAASMSVAGSVASRDSQLDYNFSVNDINDLWPRYSGLLSASGQFLRDSKGDWIVNTLIAAPYGAEAELSGQVSESGAIVDIFASLPDISPLFPSLSGPVDIAANARQEMRKWLVSMNAEGAGGITANLVGEIAEDSRTDFTAKGILPLALAEPFLSPRSLIGTGNFDLALRGGTGLSDLSGVFEMRDARFTDPNIGVAVENLRADIALADGSAIFSAAGDGRDGGGVRASGRLGLIPDLAGDIAIRADNLVLGDPRFLKTIVGADLAVRGNLGGGASISGDVTLQETTILVRPALAGTLVDIPEINHVGEPESSFESRRRAGLVKRDHDISKTRQAAYPLDISLSVPGRLFVRGRGLDAELGGAIALGGTTEKITSTGAVRLLRGRLDLLGKRFDLTEGSIGFQGGLDPSLRFIATGPIPNGQASIVLDGRASAPEVSFVSSPEAPEDEVLAQLFFGRSLSSLSVFQTVQLASAVATLAGKSGQDIVGRLRDGLNLDDFDIVSAEEGNTAVRAGKYISENVYTDVVVGPQSGEVTLNLDLNPSATLRGSVTSEGNTGVGLFFERDY